MTRPICFVDTETTCLGQLARPWEIAVVRRLADGPEEESWVWQVDYSIDTLPAGTNPEALTIGGWYERGQAWLYDDVLGDRGPEWAIAEAVHRALDGAVMVGVGVHFDAAVLSAMFRRHGLPEQPWHYAIVDLKAATWGVFAVRTAVGVAEEQEADASDLPMRSEALAAALGVEPATGADRHTALGDARWAARWFDALTGSAA